MIFNRQLKTSYLDDKCFVWWRRVSSPINNAACIDLGPSSPATRKSMKYLKSVLCSEPPTSESGPRVSYLWIRTRDRSSNAIKKGFFSNKSFCLPFTLDPWSKKKKKKKKKKVIELLLFSLISISRCLFGQNCDILCSQTV